jgi:DNA polymerase
MPDRDVYPGAASFVPREADLPALAAAVQDCRGCDLFERASQAVFGRGAPHARVVLVGEQPGDAEDRQGAPFVGPAGRLLDRALADVGIDPADTYTTNAVKHFKWTPAPGGGKRRIHATPDTWEVDACRPWLDAELALLDPEVIVVLGATAGRALLGPSFRVTKSRGALIERDGVPLLPTVHPSSVLRAPDRETAYEAFVSDLRVAAAFLAGASG